MRPRTVRIAPLAIALLLAGGPLASPAHAVEPDTASTPAVTVDSTLAASALRPSPGRAWRAGLLRGDRLEHASLAFTLAAGTGLLGRPRAQAFGVSFGLGLAKEVRDARGDRFDPVDLAADLVGAALGALAAARR